MQNKHRRKRGLKFYFPAALFLFWAALSLAGHLHAAPRRGDPCCRTPETGEKTKAQRHREAVELGRDGKYPEALSILEELLKTGPTDKSLLYDYITVLSWGGRHENALQNFRKMERDETVPLYVLSAVALSARTQRDFLIALDCFQRILEREPGNRGARLGVISCASAIGAANVALEMMEKEKNLEFSIGDIEQTRSDYAAKMIKWGELTPENEEDRYKETDIALRLLEENIKRAEADKTIPRRFLQRAHFDRLTALANRGMPEEVIKSYEAPVKRGWDIPYYALLPAADAYLNMKNPKKARELYREVLEKKPGNFDAEYSLFYAHFEGEQFRKSEKQIKELQKKHPPWLRVRGSKVIGTNTKRLGADIGVIMYDVFSRRMKKGQEQMEAVLEVAPFNRNMRTQLGRVYLWRDWPRKALREFNLVLAQQPDNLDARILKNHALMDLQKYHEVLEPARRLWTTFPERPSARKLKRDWDTNHMWYFHSEMIFKNGEGIVVASREFSIDNYLYTSPIHQWFKGFLHYYNYYASFGEWSVRHGRWGVGIDFARGDWGAQAEVLRDFSGDPDYGFRFSGRWSLDDYWELSGEYFHNAVDVPLRGRRFHLKGNTTAVGVSWRLSDLTNFGARFAHYRFNDGNRRNALTLSAQQRLYTGPKLLMYAEGEFYTSKSNMGDLYYFNPSADISYLFSLETWWVYYRRYDFKFVHRLVLAYGNYWQEHYGSGWMAVIRYEHHWDLDDRRAFLYGISYTVRPYDGNREKGFVYYATINWRF
ncbi:MAG: poly-beta-1,6 N-acetyl-D-glucosamine export porin PgaA [bacterium]|nr:poly-beta-1,6 N-acetyl-D-glucosamine export porin PgaA [bacterium]